MEVRINKEVRNYQESLFFGLSLRQFLFALLAVAVAVSVYFGLRPVLGNGEIGWVCILAAFPFALGGFFPVQRHDSGTIFIGVFSLGISHPQTACFQIGKYVRKTDGTLICEGGVES